MYAHVPSQVLAYSVAFNICRNGIKSKGLCHTFSAPARCGALVASVSRVYAVTSSHSLRLLQKAMVLKPCCMHSASSWLISTMGLRRRASGGVPACDIGGWVVGGGKVCNAVSTRVLLKLKLICKAFQNEGLLPQKAE